MIVVKGMLNLVIHKLVSVAQNIAKSTFSTNTAGFYRDWQVYRPLRPEEQ
jgi:hypothetical protein